MTDLNKLQCWPLRGFAPGGYQCKCSGCRKDFIGDKRAGECLECAIKGAQKLVAKLNDDIIGMGEELGKADILITNPKESIVAAAIQVEGVTISLPLPARHGQVLHAAEAMQLPSHMLHAACQGFLTSEGRFVNRVQAKQIAHMAGQSQLRPQRERHDRDLFSEDLW